MNRYIPFDKGELKHIGVVPGLFGGPDTPIRDTPITPHENVAALFHDKHPYWMVTMADSGFFFDELYPMKMGRGGWTSGTTDVFGLEWEYVEIAQGSITKPGDPMFSNANEWKDFIQMPDLDTWDWAGEAEKVKLDKALFNQYSFVNGFWFERLISFMDFENAAVALLDPDQLPAVLEFFEAFTELGCKLVDKFIEYWPALGGFNIHDDWGSQRAPFFSNEIGEKFIPYMKTLTDYIHSKGRVATLHSCGANADRIQIFIDGGFDQWTPQDMNDTHKLFDEFGDKIIVAAIPDPFDPINTPEAEQRERARAFVDKFCQKGKSANTDFYSAWAFSEAFAEEVYEYSRKKYLTF